MIEEEKQGNIFEILALVGFYWKKLRLWLIVALLVGAALGFFMYRKEASKPVSYYGFSTFMLSSDDVSSGGGGFGAAMGIMLPGSGGNGNKTILLELLKSHAMIERTMLTSALVDGDSDLLINHYIKLAGYREAWKSDPVWKDYKYPKNYKRDIDEVRDGFLRTAAIEIAATYVPAKTDEGIFSITFINSNEAFTKAFMDNIIVTLIDYYTEKKTAKSKIMYEYAKQRYDQLSGKISSQEQSLAKMQDKSSEFVFLEDKVPQLRAQREIGTSSGLLQEAAKSLAAASMSLVQETPFVQVIDDVRLPLAIMEPPKMKKGLIGFAIGFLGIALVAAGLVFGKEYLKKQKEAFNQMHQK